MPKLKDKEKNMPKSHSKGTSDLELPTTLFELYTSIESQSLARVKEI